MSWRLMCSLLLGISAAASVSCDAGPVIQRPAGAGGAASPRTTAEATPQSAASLDPTRASSTLPAQSATSPAVYGGTVHHDIRVWVFIDPLTARRDNQFLFGEAFSGLVSISGGSLGEASPELAESWTVSGDGLTYTFRLRDGLRFSDGTPLSAEDVKWSWERALAPENATEEAK